MAQATESPSHGLPRQSRSGWHSDSTISGTRLGHHRVLKLSSYSTITVTARVTAPGPPTARGPRGRTECSADACLPLRPFPLTSRSRPGAGLGSCDGSFQVNGRASLATPAQIHPGQTGLDQGDRYSLVQAQARGSNRERPGPGPGGWDFELQVAGGARIVPVIH